MSAELVLHLELDKFDIVGGKQIVKDASGRHCDGEINGRVDLVEDESFGACATFDGAAGSYISVPSSEALVMTGDFTVQAWVRLSNEAFKSAKIVGGGERPNGGYRLLLDREHWAFQCSGNVDRSATVKVPEIALDTWYHLAGVMEGTKASLYVHNLHGKRIGSEEIRDTVTADGSPNGSLTIGVLGNGKSSIDAGKIAHVRLYKSARTQAQIEKDMADDRLALAPFRKSHPIDFHLYDDDDQAVLYITDDPDGHNLNVELRNTSTQAIRLNASDPKGPASEANHHFVLRFNPGVLSKRTLDLWVKPHEQTHLMSSDEPWEIYFPPKQPDAGEMVSLYLLYKGDEAIFLPNQRRTLKLRHMGAAPGSGARGTQVQLHPRGLTAAGGDSTAITGMRTQYMHITNQRGHKAIPLHVWLSQGHTVSNDGRPHSLVLRIGNGSEKVDIALADKSRGAPSKFTISFDVGDQADSWGLTDKAGAGKVVVTVKQGDGELTETARGQGAGRQWELSFPAARTLAKRGTPGHHHLDITIGNLVVPAGWRGHANLYVRYENIPGYQDGQFILTVEKSPVAVVRGFIGTPGVGRPDSSDYILSVNGGVLIGVPSDPHPGNKNLRVDGEISGQSLRLRSGPTVRDITTSASPPAHVQESIATVSYLNELVGSMHNALFFATVKIRSQPDAALQLEFDPKHKPRVTIIDNKVAYSGLLKLTTRNLAWHHSSKKWDDVLAVMQEKSNKFNMSARLVLSIVTEERGGTLSLRSNRDGPNGIPAIWQLLPDGMLYIRLTEGAHQTMYQYSGYPRGLEGVFQDNFKESAHWIDLSEITYKL